MGITRVAKRNPRTGLWEVVSLSGETTSAISTSNGALARGQIVRAAQAHGLTAIDWRNAEATESVRIARQEDKAIAAELFTVEYCSLAYQAVEFARFPVGGDPRPPAFNLTPYIESFLAQNYCFGLFIVRDETTFQGGDSTVYLALACTSGSLVSIGRVASYIVIDRNAIGKPVSFNFNSPAYSYPGEMVLESRFFRKIGEDSYLYLTPRGGEVLGRTAFLATAGSLGINRQYADLVDYYVEDI